MHPLDDYHWRGAKYIGPVFVRADEEIAARGVAQMAFGIAADKPPGGKVPLMPWATAWLSSCELVTDTEYVKEGPEELLSPEAALDWAHPGIKGA